MKDIFLSDYVEIEVEGHAQQAPKGCDIVCAAVSVLSQNLVLSLAQLLGVKQRVKQSSGYLKTSFEVKESDNKQKEAISLLLRSFEIGVRQLVESYSQFITIEY